MATKLCQIIAVEKSAKNKSHQNISDVYQKMQKPALLTGITRSYTPKDEDGEQLPSETTKVQMSATQFLTDVANSLTDLLDITATKDYANCKATADIVVGDVVLAKSVPVTYLLFLEKKLVDIHTFVSKLPTLDLSDEWTFNPNSSCYATNPVDTTRTKKVFVPIVLSPATDKHPANIKESYEDRVVGYWKTVKFSGALPAQKVNEMLERVEKLQKAVKFAREECNTMEVSDIKVGKKIFSYLFD